MGKSPLYLYHYTSINTLGFILMNRSFRFNSLKNMDDYDEVKIHNMDLGQYCYVSCWTDEEEESIPMWKMYSDNLRGIRIRLPIFPFETYRKDSETYIINPHNIINDSYYYWKPYEETFLRPVTYKSINELENIKNGEMANKNLNYFGYDAYLPGEYKNNFWCFQREWRYRILIIPTKERVECIDFANIDYEYLKYLPEPPFTNMELKIKDEMFEKMEITLGPKVNDSDKMMVRLMLEKYNPNIILKESVLAKRI